MMATQIDGGEPLPTWLSTWWLLPSQAGQADVALSAPTHLESPLALVDLLRTAMRKSVSGFSSPYATLLWRRTSRWRVLPENHSVDGLPVHVHRRIVMQLSRLGD